MSADLSEHDSFRLPVHSGYKYLRYQAHIEYNAI